MDYENNVRRFPLRYTQPDGLSPDQRRIIELLDKINDPDDRLVELLLVEDERHLVHVPDVQRLDDGARRLDAPAALPGPGLELLLPAHGRRRRRRDVVRAQPRQDLRLRRPRQTALAETERTEVPTVAVCDTNVNPNQVTHPIPANDDAVNSIKMIADMMAEAVNEGRKEFEKKKLEKVATAKAAPVAEEAPAKHRAEKPEKTERRALKKEESV